MKILVAEDDPVSRLVLTSILRKLGHEVAEVPDGLEAWATFQQTPFAVVVSDWMMPSIDGLELTRRIRAADRVRYTYVILLTALSGRERYLEGMEAGADDFLTKPLDAEELRVRLRVAERILGLQAAVKQLEGLLPICAYCKKIRDEGGSWVRVETYVEQRTEAQFSHGICPECAAKVREEIRNDRQQHL